MTVPSAAATVGLYDMEQWGNWLDRRGHTGTAHVLLDSKVVGSPVDATVSGVLAAHGVRVRRHVTEPHAQLDELRTWHRELGRGDLVVGVGGGGVMDQAKILCLLASDDSADKRLCTGQRCGFIVVPRGVRRRLSLTLVPTTLGTGAEISRSACVESAGRKRLAYGDALRADCPVVSPAATQDLPTELVTEGVVEALLRLVSCYVGSRTDLPRQDEMVERYATHLIRLGERVRSLRDRQLPIPSEIRESVAALSAASHLDEIVDGRDPYCDVCWPLANEMSMFGDGRKLPALAALTPAVWSRVSAGDERLGSARRLARLWELLDDASDGPLDAEPSRGLAGLLARWKVSPAVAPDPADIPELANRAADAWGRGLPMLKGLLVDEIGDIYRDALDRPPATLSALVEERR